MKKIIIYVLFFVLFTSNVNASESFIEGMEDIPLVPNLIQDKPDNFSFGNEETRIVEAYFKSEELTSGKVENFYLETLPQLGWMFNGKSKNTLIFKRNQEELDIITESKNPLIIRITLTGRP